MGVMDENVEGDGSRQRWEGYSNYQYVSQQLASKVSDAVEAYSILQSAGREGVDIPAGERMRARARILDAAMSLKIEVEKEADDESDGPYESILDRWTDGGKDVEDGYIQAFHSLSVQEDGVPGWVYQFVEDIRRAAWELGYLQAGRTVTEDDLEPADKQAREMFE